LKDFKRARGAFEESLQINPFDPEVHLGLAQACEMLGDPADAAKAREVANKLRR
jgi:cytochrome c-type biogenesis protein CcmH/NrfG